MITEAIVLAGGLGTRLRKVVSDVPKSMALINGKPFLEYQLNYLESWGIDHVVLSVGYKHDIIRNYFGDQFQSIAIDYAIEEKPLGTGGGIRMAFKKINSYAAFVFNGDTFFEVNLKRLFDFRRIKETDVCLALRFTDDISRYGAVELDKDYRINGFTEKGKKTGEGYINGGVYYIRRDFFLNFDWPEKFSIEKDFFEKYFQEYAFYGIRCFSYFIDIGIPEDYARAQKEFKSLPH